MDIFNNGDYKFISNLVEKNLPMLRQIDDFNEQYVKLFDLMDEFTKNLSKEQKDLFDDIIKLFYCKEEYYFALSYMYGHQFNDNLQQLF
jgi:hypothetical protein